MKNLSKGKKFLIIALAVIILLFVIVEIYKISNANMLDKSKYKSLVEQLEQDLSKTSTTDEIFSVLTSYADKNNISYVVDNAKNIIFHVDADESKTSVAPTVVCVSYNYKDITDSVMPLASALTIAGSNIHSGEYTVLIINNENNLGAGYKMLSNKYFSDNSNVIFLDCGDDQYLSSSSFNASTNYISIPLETVTVKYDSAIKVNITGISTFNIGDKIGLQPNPINSLSNILAKLKAKSIGFQLTNLNVEYSGNMYPQGISFTILLDSYSVETMTSYLDGRIEKFDKNYKDDFPNASFTYKVVEKEGSIPDYAYSDSATDSLNTLIYTIKNSAYRFESDNVPDGSNVNDIYAINCITNIVANTNSIDISLFTEGINDAYLTQILKENATAAEMASANASTGNKIAAYKCSDSTLSKSMTYSFFKSNHSWYSPQLIPESSDSFFTECSYLQNINAGMHILHMRSKESLMDEYTNTLLYFIKVQGNFLSL